MDWNRREFIALAGEALSILSVASAFTESSDEIKYLVNYADGRPLLPDAASLEAYNIATPG